MIRHLKITSDTAVKSRSQAMVTLKTMIVNALDQISGKIVLVWHIAAFRPDAMSFHANCVGCALLSSYIWTSIRRSV